MGAIGKPSFKHGYAKHWDVPVSPESSPVGGTEGAGTTVRARGRVVPPASSGSVGDSVNEGGGTRDSDDEE